MRQPPPGAGGNAPRPRFGLRRRDRGRLRGLPLTRLLPNLLTMLGLCAGLVAIRLALEARFAEAAAMICVAGVLDGLDGRLARLLHATSRFGAEFDSLADFLSFGVAPALLLYLWALAPLGALGFLPALLFAVCAALRLARFNAALEIGPAARPAPKPVAAAAFFTGVPAPAGAGCALMPLFAALAAGGWGLDALAAALRHPAVAGLALAAVAALMVSTLPSWSFKGARIPRGAALPLLLGAALYLALLLAEPWAALAGAGLLYLGLLPLAWRAARRAAGAP